MMYSYGAYLLRKISIGPKCPSLIYCTNVSFSRKA